MKTLIETFSGKVQGFRQNDLVKFLGIRFAQPPIGELRFRRARPVQPWAGVFDATSYGNASLQSSQDSTAGSEDCLTLNIVRPEAGNNLPVLVWIHGGGFMTGTASDLLYQGDQFARGGVIFVSIEYRLNVLGVFDFSTFSGCEDFESNCALSDMIEALKWINHNISAFGGDAGNITIAGESAGGTAVVTLMAVPQVRGLFRRVIAQSALCNCVMTPQMARRNSELFIEGMGWSENDLQKLCTDDSASFLQGVDYVGRKHQYRNPGIFLPGPVIDDLLPLRPLEAIRAGHASGISLIIGTNLNEGTMFVRPEDTNFPDNWEMVQETFTKNGNTKGFAAIKRYYSDERHLARHGSPLVHFATDYAFEMPSIKVAEA